MAVVARDAALAVVLLGLQGAGVARAGGAPVFDAIVPNPLASIAVGFRAAPALGDLDADGDPDVLSGEYGGGFRYFANTGSARTPAYVERTGLLNPASGLTAASVHSHPALVDLDGDGDLDLVTGSYAGTFEYFRNQGNARNPALVPTVNPFAGLDVGQSSAPSFGDLDADGDPDLIAGDRAGFFHFFENTGNATNPAFVERVGSTNPMNAFSIGQGLSSLASPALGDADGDGDLDLVAAQGSGDFRFYQNTGTARRPAFKELGEASNPLRGESAGSAFAKAVLGDLDGDGDLDLVSGTDAGTLVSFANRLGRFAISTEIDAPALGLPILDSNGAPFPGTGDPTAIVDIDADGDLDLWGNSCSFRLNTGSAVAPAFLATSNPLGFPVSCVHVAVAGDQDADGDVDLSIDGTYFRNTGTASSPAFLGLLAPVMPTGDLPRFADLDGDGDLDAVTVTDVDHSSLTDDRIQYFERTGAAGSPGFVERFGVDNRINPTDSLTARTVTLGDLDGDGDVDAAVSPGLLNQSEFLLENVGSRSTPVFLARTGTSEPFFGGLTLRRGGAGFGDFDRDGDLDSFGFVVTPSPLSIDAVYLENGIVRPSPKYFGPLAVPFSSENAGFLSSPAAGDLDTDGDPDFVVAGSFGTGALRYFENTGTAVMPRVVERAGASNPFDGSNAGTTPLLAFVDLDADGDLDLVAGSYVGDSLHYFKNTGTSRSPAFVEQVSGLNPLQFVLVDRSAPAFGDLDADGDPDLVVGGVPGTIRYFRNVGLAVSSLYGEVTGAANPFNGLVVGTGFMAHPTLGDVDRDGDLDLVAGDEPTGGFFYFENTGNASAPAFASRTGPENPLDGLGVGGGSAPTLVDLDADGDLDVVSGAADGSFETFTLPEPSMAGLLGAGVAMLAWLRRRRTTD